MDDQAIEIRKDILIYFEISWESEQITSMLCAGIRN